MHTAAVASAIETARLRRPAAPAAPAFPPEYGLIYDGESLEPGVYDGLVLIFDTRVPLTAGDLVVLHGLEGSKTICRLVTVPPPWVSFPWRDDPSDDCAAALLVRSITTGKVWSMPCRAIAALHVCTGSQPAA